MAETLGDGHAVRMKSDDCDGDAFGQGPHGGSAAIYGLLHQITFSMRQLLHAQFGRNGGKPDTATVIAIFEPRPGGDLSLESSNREVSQIKHRAKPVSTAEISGKVLPDLFRAHCDRPADKYTLHTTNGISGPSTKLIALCKRWAEGYRSDAGPRTEVGLNIVLEQARFVHMGADSTLPFEESFSAFLLRFDHAPPVDADRARADVLRWLKARVAYGERAEAELDSLIGYVFSRAKQNDTRIDVDELLARLGLPGGGEGHPMSNAARLSATLGKALETREYDPSRDVRDPIVVNRADPLTLITGSSGCGKSWALFRVATACLQDGTPAVLVRADTMTELLHQLSRSIAVEALRREQPVQPMQLGLAWRRQCDDPSASIVVLWEGCRDATALEDIRLAGGLGAGLTLIAEFPVGDAERLADFKAVPTHHVGEFTPHQLFEALRLRGIAAGNVPQQIRKMLHLPVLCGIYSTLALEMDRWNPLTEYRVLEDFWARARKRVGHLAGAYLKKFARTMVTKHRAAIGDDDVDALGVGKEELLALIAAGWLTCDGGRWSFAHDRLLTWAIAEAITSDFANGTLDAAGLAESVIALENRGGDETKAMFPSLGFLMMDVIWLLGDMPQRDAEVASFLEAFEPEELTGAVALYGELIATTGTRMRSALIERTKRVTDGNSRIEGSLVTAFLSMPFETGERASLIADLWCAEVGAGRSIAISLGAQWPMTAYRDQLWQDYCELSADREADAFNYEHFRKLENALRAVARADPQWLIRCIAAEEGQEELRLAAFLLKSLDSEAGDPAWRTTRDRLFERIPADRQSVLIECAKRFNDRSVVPRLLDMIRNDHRLSSYAFEAVVVIDPVAGLALLEAKPSLPTPPHGRTWMDRLLDIDAGRAVRALTEWLQGGDPSGGTLAAVWSRAEDRIDAATLDLLLNCLAEAFERPPGQDRRDPTSALLSVLGSLTLDPSHDALFQLRCGTALSKALKARAIAHFDGVHDDLYVEVRRLLRRISGNEYEALILHALSPVEIGHARTGIASSIFLPSPKVLERLSMLATNASHTVGDDEPRLDLWRMLLAIAPELWRPRLTALLESVEEQDILLSLHLIPEFPEESDHSNVLQCLARSASGSAVEARAMNVAAAMGAPDAVAVDRAIRRLGGESDDQGRLGALNILLADRSETGRAALDAHLAPLETAKSWRSDDSEALAIRLGQGDARDSLWRAGERMLQRPSLFGDRIVGAFIERDPSRTKSILLERAFAPPDWVTSTQPEAIFHLSQIDKPLATEAFVRAWADHKRRRQYLAPCARDLDDTALLVMINHLDEDVDARGGGLALRAACVELRRRHQAATPLLLSRFAVSTTEARRAICTALGWMPGSVEILAGVITGERDSEVQEVARSVQRHWRQVEAATAKFREVRTLETMEYLIEIADPSPLTSNDDPLRIIEDIQADSRLIAFAEKQFARRFNEVSKTHYKRVKVRADPPRASSDLA